MIAALYVDAKGAYAGLADVELWPISRDARQYAGPWPVVAHPPCQLWGPLAAVNFARWGGEHNRDHWKNCPKIHVTHAGVDWHVWSYRKLRAEKADL